MRTSILGRVSETALASVRSEVQAAASSGVLGSFISDGTPLSAVGQTQKLVAGRSAGFRAGATVDLHGAGISGEPVVVTRVDYFGGKVTFEGFEQRDLPRRMEAGGTYQLREYGAARGCSARRTAAGSMK